MRFVLIVICVVLLVACGTENGKNIVIVENDPDIEVSDTQFTFKLVTEKSQYKVGEKIAVKAMLTNNAGEDVEIGHGGTWLWMETTNVTENYQFGAAMNEPYIVTPIKSGETIAHKYYFSGGAYLKGAPGEPYSNDEHMQMASLEFPVGQYQIDARTDFEVIGVDAVIEYKGTIIFEVIK